MRGAFSSVPVGLWTVVATAMTCAASLPPPDAGLAQGDEGDAGEGAEDAERLGGSEALQEEEAGEGDGGDGEEGGEDGRQRPDAGVTSGGVQRIGGDVECSSGDEGAELCEVDVERGADRQGDCEHDERPGGAGSDDRPEGVTAGGGRGGAQHDVEGAEAERGDQPVAGARG